MHVPRPEPPNPANHRPNWRTLNGAWELAVDDDIPIRKAADRPAGEHPGRVPTFDRSVLVPYSPQSELGGEVIEGDHPSLWYRRSFTLHRTETGKRVYLIFGAVDYQCWLWVNRRFAGMHRGGYTPFRTEITDLVAPGENEILLHVIDRRDPSQPRGKQSWQAPFNCWYQECSGIWQPVWLEFTPQHAIGALQVHSTVTSVSSSQSGSAHLELRVHPSDPCDGTIEVTVRSGELLLGTARAKVRFPCTLFHMGFDEVPLWSPESPELVEIEVRMRTVSGTDALHSYTGFRRVEIRSGILHLNDEPLYQRLILDQGYWAGGLYTAPNDASFRTDIELALAMGFNGCRKHAKIEDPRFYYWADRLGYLVWAELPPAYEFTARAQRDLLDHTVEMVQRGAGHPSIIAWTLFNESWGVPDVHRDPEQRGFIVQLAETVRRLDPQRLVIANDGWEMVGGDIYGLHSYAAEPAHLAQDLSVAFGPDGTGTLPHSKATEPLLRNGRRFRAVRALPSGRLRMITEFGGTGYLPRDNARSDAWGYENPAQTPEDLRERIGGLLRTVRQRRDLAGFVYTQLADVEQEVNGLCYVDRTPKIPISDIRDIIINNF